MRLVIGLMRARAKYSHKRLTIDMESPAEDVPLGGQEDQWSFLSHAITPRKFIRAATPQALAVVAWVAAAIWIMNLCNAFVYSRLPLEGPLPDLVADSYKNYGYLRGNAEYMSSQPADMLLGFLTVSSILSTILFYDPSNCRKLGVVYSICLHLRSFFFMVTGLPPTCIGYPQCRCAVTPYKAVTKGYSLPMVATFYTLAFGVFLDRIPQCGDLTMSGHTVYIWSFALYFLENMERILSRSLFLLLKTVIYLMIGIAIITIVLIRNHYTIDIVLATVFTNLVWTGYTWAQHLVNMRYKPFCTSLPGRIFMWIELVPGHEQGLRESNAI